MTVVVTPTVNSATAVPAAEALVSRSDVLVKDVVVAQILVKPAAAAEPAANKS